MAKEKEDKKVVAKLTPEQDDVSLFYSDLMPLLVSSMISKASILLYILIAGIDFDKRLVYICN